ncbi:Xaa-Pro peptidase family protein [Amycolatopsis sp. NPDC049253]|uniref:M24 family metallopeptidase n=1 Tax=Amycolatopsis sp. NPDC049253 TaxID=3155274 RepID=UPI00343DCC57
MNPPFDHRHLDELMERAGLDALVVTSKHNVQYLLGGHRFFFFDYMDAIGTSRYLPTLVYVRGELDATRYIGNAMESWQLDNDPVWVSDVDTSTWRAQDAIELALAHLLRVLPGQAVVGIEGSFLPVEAYQRLAADPSVTLRDGQFVLERLRAVKRADELKLLEEASDAIVHSMEATFGEHGAGSTKREIVQTLRQEQTRLGMTFEYCLVSMGASHNRAPSNASWAPGEVLCLDSGGNLGGYIGDLARMAVLGEPDAELEDLLAEVEAVQLAAREPIADGVVGQAIFERAGEVLATSPHRAVTTFVAHGMGLISHEAPRLTSTGPVPYPNYDGPRALAAGMVLSIETTMLHPRRGFIKLEDTVTVTAEGHRAFGDRARGWNVVDLAPTRV